jgi:hypothetical protein
MAARVNAATAPSHAATAPALSLPT